MHRLGILQSTLSSCSIVACGTILFTFCVFPDLRKKSFIATVFFICCCDLLASVGLAFANLGEHHVGFCWAQGIIVNYFSLGSVMWTVVICLMMYWIKVRGKSFVVNSYCHLFCWGVPAVSTFLPLINSRYEYTNDTACILAPYTASNLSWLAILWRWLSYYGIIWAAIAANAVLLALVYRRIRIDAKNTSIETQTTHIMYLALKKLCWYPAIMLIVYGENCIADTLMTRSENNKHLRWTTAILPCLVGCLNSAAFWISNPDIRKHLVQHLFSIEKQVIAIPEHFFHFSKEGAIIHSIHSIHNAATNLANKVKPAGDHFIRDLEKAIEEQSLHFDFSSRRASASLGSVMLSISVTRSKRKASKPGQVHPGGAYELVEEEGACGGTDQGNKSSEDNNNNRKDRGEFSVSVNVPLNVSNTKDSSGRDDDGGGGEEKNDKNLVYLRQPSMDADVDLNAIHCGSGSPCTPYTPASPTETTALTTATAESIITTSSSSSTAGIADCQQQQFHKAPENIVHGFVHNKLLTQPQQTNKNNNDDGGTEMELSVGLQPLPPIITRTFRVSPESGPDPHLSHSTSSRTEPTVMMCFSSDSNGCYNNNNRRGSEEQTPSQKAAMVQEF